MRNKNHKSDSPPLGVLALFFVILIFHEAGVEGQDYHFTQYFAAPLLVNPSYTGTSGSDFRFANIYRNQWAKIGTPYETFSTSLDKRLVIMNHIFGIGGALVHDQSSSFNLTADEILLSLSYSLLVNSNQFSFGIQSGFVSRSYDPRGLTFGSQFDPSGEVFDPSLPNLENGLNQKMNYIDINAGLSWRTMFNKITPSAGFSVNHINMPEERFSTSSSGKRLPMKMTLNAQVNLPVNKKFDVTPSLLFNYTAGADELLAGALGGYNVDNAGFPVKRLTAMSMVRVNPVKNIDAFILGGGAEFLNFNLGISYDFNISPLSKVTNFNGAFEISLVYKGHGRNKKTGPQPCNILN